MERRASPLTPKVKRKTPSPSIYLSISLSALIPVQRTLTTNGSETPMNFSPPSGEECGPLLTRAPGGTTRHRSTAQVVSAPFSTTRRRSPPLNILQDNIVILGNEFIRAMVGILRGFLENERHRSLNKNWQGVDYGCANVYRNVH